MAAKGRFTDAEFAALYETHAGDFTALAAATGLARRTVRIRSQRSGLGHYTGVAERANWPTIFAAMRAGKTLREACKGTGTYRYVCRTLRAKFFITGGPEWKLDMDSRVNSFRDTNLRILLEDFPDFLRMTTTAQLQTLDAAEKNLRRYLNRAKALITAEQKARQ